MSGGKNKFGQTEAESELERMFGHEDDQKLTGFDVIRLRLVQRQYSRSNIFYRMFFDKHYRPDRYNCIISDQKKHRNVKK